VRLVSFLAASSGTRVGELLEDHSIAGLHARTMIEWLSGCGRERTAERFDLADVRLLAPIPDPPSIRDFYAFEGHVAAGFRLRGRTIPEAWYEAPVFYFTNPAAVFGPGEAIRRPVGCERLDFELEIAAAVGPDGTLGGFMLMNDWSARDIQAREMTVGLGPAKGKDFATSFGPWLVTPDELPYDGERLNLEAAVFVGERPVARAQAHDMHFSWPELFAQAARNTVLRPGDVLGSGTLAGGCLLELGPIDGHWIEPGDVVTLEAMGLGTLRTPVTA
jgi:fumarylacetoacetate (FAA) hydrolase